MKNLLREIKAAIHSADYVGKFQGRTRKNAVAFVSKLLATGILLTAAIYLGILVPGVSMFLNGETVAKYYPDGLEVSITNGVVSTNQPEPYVIKDTFSDKGDIERANLFVIDTKVEDPLAAFASYDTYALLTRDSLIVSENETETRVFSLSKAKAVHLTEARAVGWLNDALPTIWGLGAAFAMFLIVFTFVVSLLYYLVILFPLAALARFMAGKKGWEMNFEQAYVLSAYLLTLAVVVDLVAGFFFQSVPILLTLALFVAAFLLNVKQKPLAPVEPTPLP